MLAAGHGFAAEGPTSFHAQYRERATRTLAGVDPSPQTVREADLVDLPMPLAAYVRRYGALGQPRFVNFHADFHGRIRSGPTAAWMPFTGQQVNTYGPQAQRILLMDATRSGHPLTVLHEFVDTTATMRVKLLSLLTVVDAFGPEMDRGETVTVFNDLVDFVSDDRTRASADGKAFTQQRWSTPLAGHHDTNGHRVPAAGEGVWHATQPEGSFTYLEFHLGAISYNVGDAETTTTPPQPALAIHSTGR